ncbi:MAG: peptidoglycan DD-metalloendopeptidase family protein [Arenimonas sp.]|nr:peptidoglycan DD-metalloendopeptidase family protein [Arenimonas sp.]
MTQWHSAGLYGLIGACVISLVPALQSNASAHKPLPLVKYISSTYQRKAIDFRTFHWQVVTVEPGQTLSEIFNNLDVSHTVMRRVLENDSAKQAFKRIKDGDVIEFEMNGYNQLRAMRFDKSDVEQVLLNINEQEITEQITERKIENRLLVASGTITDSLYADAQRAGLNATIVRQIADIFKYDVDFAEDLRDGDQFQVVYQQSYLEGKPYKQGQIQAATFINRGEKFTAYRYNYNGKEQYFDGNGRPLKKVLMRIPIEFARLSSTFGMRKHPVLGRMRAHKGVDYAARTGTPIMAAGDGRIELAGWKSGYGKTVIINHGQGRSTLYGHMSSIGKLKRGQSVSQGSIIGRVGSTGLATGPHLHYEFRINGNQVNPLKVTMPKPEPLRGSELAKFKSATAPAIAMMEQSKTTQLR